MHFCHGSIDVQGSETYMSRSSATSCAKSPRLWLHLKIHGPRTILQEPLPGPNFKQVVFWNPNRWFAGTGLVTRRSHQVPNRPSFPPLIEWAESRTAMVDFRILHYKDLQSQVNHLLKGLGRLGETSCLHFCRWRPDLLGTWSGALAESWSGVFD